MSKILIACLSLNGHTRQLADYIAEGVRISGNEAVVQNITELQKPDDLAGYDGFIFGCPTYHRDMPAAMKPFLFMAKNAGLADKSGGAFGSYTHSGDAPKIVFDTMEHVFRMNVVSLGALNVLEDRIDTQDYIRACHDYARAVCEAAG